MTTTPGNPFAFPGMGLGTNPDGSAGNPVLQSMEMMRQAWSQMGGANPFAGALPTTPILNPEELDKRIQELQAVANWLRLNMTMLQGSIQALEVQRATIATLRSFAQSAGHAATGGAATGEPSPLEVALGIKPQTRTAQEPPAPASAAPQPAQAAPEKAAAPAPDSPAPDKAADSVGQTQQAWWNLLQNQFNQLAQAAAATLPTPPAPAASSRATPKTQPAAPARKPAAKAAPAARKSAPRKAAPRKRGSA